MPRILIIEDELPMRTALADTLIDEGHRVLTAEDGEKGLETALREKPALILLDIMMPKIDGFAVCESLRRHGCEAPVLMLTAKGEVDDRVRGFDAGADDYLVKPFSTRELLARVRALLRRAGEEGAAPGSLRLGAGIHIDFRKQVATRNGDRIDLTAKEFGMLRLFAERTGEPVTREEFLDRVWGYAAYPSTRTVDNHIASLRAKLEADPAHPRHIVTVHRVGYRLEPPADKYD